LNPIVLVSLRAVLAYFFLLLLSRLMGRKMISQLTFFDFVMGVTVGNLTANVAMGAITSPWGAAAVLAVMTVLTVGLDCAHIKSFMATKIFDSEPMIIVEQGQIIYDNLRRARLPLTQLLMLLRQKNIFNLGDVDYAVLEIDGQLTVLLKPQYQPTTPSDMGFTPQYRGLTRDLVLDGELQAENLSGLGLTREAFLKQLRDQGVEDVKDVVYAGMNSADELYISHKTKEQETHGQHGIE